MQNTMTPKQMARTYWIFKRVRAIREIEGILENFKDAPKTVDYWKQVLSCLQAKLK